MLDANRSGTLAPVAASEHASHHVQVAADSKTWTCPTPPAKGGTAKGYAGKHAEIVVGADLLLGFSKHADGRQSLIITNVDHTLSAFLHLEFQNGTTVVEIDSMTGEEAPVVDELDQLAGLQLSLDAAQGRLLLLTKN